MAATARLDQLQAQPRDLTHRRQEPKTALAARNVHLTDQILAVLAGQSPLRLSTPPCNRPATAGLTPPAGTATSTTWRSTGS